MKRAREVPISREDVRKVLAAMADDYILVGGQALVFWIEYFGVHNRLDVVTRDVDILARDFEDVRKIAVGIGGKPILQNKAAISALLGCVRIDHGDNEYATLDVIDRVLGMSREQVVNRAVEIELPPLSRSFHVMHPIDVTESRIVNFCELKEKQDGNGEAQLVMALDVARRFIETADEAFAIDAIEKLVRLAMKYQRRVDKLAPGVFLGTPLYAINTRNFALPQGKRFIELRQPQIMALLDDLQEQPPLRRR